MQGWQCVPGSCSSAGEGWLAKLWETVLESKLQGRAVMLWGLEAEQRQFVGRVVFPQLGVEECAAPGLCQLEAMPASVLAHGAAGADGVSVLAEGLASVSSSPGCSCCW